MTEPAFKLFVIVLLLVIWSTTNSASKNALEAHRHTHELACHIENGKDLCDFLKGAKP